MNKFTLPEKEIINHYVLENISTCEIARKYNVNRSVIKRILLSNNIEIEPQKKKIPQEIINLVIEEYNKGEHGMAEIGNKFDLSREIIKRILKNNHIDLHNPGQRFKGGKKEADKKYYNKNKEKIKIYQKNWMSENREKLRDYGMEWRKDNEDHRQKRANYETNRKRVDPIHRLKCNLRTAIWTNLKERGIVKHKRTMELLDFTIEELIVHLENQFTPGMTWENYGQWHVDHIIPLHIIKESPEDVLHLWRLENLQPLWASSIELSGVTYQGNLNKGKRLEYCGSAVIRNFMNNHGIEYLEKFIIFDDPVDFYLPEYKIAIEYCELKNHTEFYGKKSRSYHIHKTDNCAKKGIHLIHIFEDEMIYKENIVISKLRHILKLNDEKIIHARKCEIREIDAVTKNEFLNKFHIQGENKSPIKLGAFYENNIIAVMTFDNVRGFNKTKLKNEKDEYELTRFCVSNVICNGICAKMLKHFIKIYTPKKIISMADRRWTKEWDNIYLKLGFIQKKHVSINYFYYNEKISQTKRFHKFNYGLSGIKKKFKISDDEIYSKTESEWMKHFGYDRIWDCGKLKYELIIQNNPYSCDP